MSNMHIRLESPVANAVLTVESTPLSRRLEAYPLLVFAAARLRTEDTGTPVALICAMAAMGPDADYLAAYFGTTVEHVGQALAYRAEYGDDT